jgi:hypothetical protein
MFKAIYSKLCADYFDQQHKETQWNEPKNQN